MPLERSDASSINLSISRLAETHLHPVSVIIAHFVH